MSDSSLLYADRKRGRVIYMYDLKTAVWEITMGCNMRCKHCGSTCTEPKEGELSTEEALSLCNSLIEMGMEDITLSGGEPTTRPDWDKIVSCLTSGNVKTSIITNGWLIDDDVISKVKKAGIYTVCISIDGLKETHDYIRRQGSFDRDTLALRKLKEKDISTAVITTVSSANIDELESMYSVFNEIGIDIWQLQIAMEMGNFRTQNEFSTKPEYIDKIINFAYSKIGKGIKVTLADCIGYYNLKGIEVIKDLIPEYEMWQGCGAGKNSIGILHNGDITACTSLRDTSFIVGNIRNQSLREIWEDDNNFKWNRMLTKDKISGFCGKCQYGSVCLGGCTNSRLCQNDDIYGENRFCSYHNEMQKELEKINNSDDQYKLETLFIEELKNENYQVAEMMAAKLLQIDANNEKYLEWAGYVNYQLENYLECLNINNKLLKINESSVNGQKGIILASINLHRLEDVKSDIYKYSDDTDMEILYDIYLSLINAEYLHEADNLLGKICKRSGFEEWRERFEEITV